MDANRNVGACRDESARCSRTSRASPGLSSMSSKRMFERAFGKGKSVRVDEFTLSMQRMVSRRLAATTPRPFVDYGFFSSWQLDDSQPEILNRRHNAHKLLEVDRLADVAVGVKIITLQNIFFGGGSRQIPLRADRRSSGSALISASTSRPSLRGRLRSSKYKIGTAWHSQRVPRAVR